jgi:DNA integrity scanning protein DisA with diadenylate cyclase activity
MAKRQPLTFDNSGLTKDLKESAGKGVDAFFPSSNPSPVQTPPQNVSPKPAKPKKEAAIKHETERTINQTGNLTSNMTILQFTNDEIEELREPAYKAQTFRLTEKETEWVKDTSYRLSKEIKRGKVSQADILRISFRLFENLLALNKEDLIKILEKIK